MEPKRHPKMKKIWCGNGSEMHPLPRSEKSTPKFPKAPLEALMCTPVWAKRSFPKGTSSEKDANYVKKGQKGASQGSQLGSGIA